MWVPSPPGLPASLPCVSDLEFSPCIIPLAALLWSLAYTPLCMLCSTLGALPAGTRCCLLCRLEEVARGQGP